MIRLTGLSVNLSFPRAKQRSHIVAFTNAYHGHTLGSLALTGNRYYHDEHYGSHNNVTHLPYDGYLQGLDSSTLLRRMLDDPSSGLPTPAAVIVETVQCEGGVRIASTEWIQKIRDICHQRDILLIVDDIQVGNGRTGKFFSFEEAVIEPDLVCLSKSIGGGLPMSLVLIERSCDVWKPGEHTGTFRGNNLAFVAAEVLLNYWRDDELEQQIFEHGRTIRHALEAIAGSYPDQVVDVRGRGMVWGIDLDDGAVANRIVQDLFHRGLIVETAGAEGNVVKLLPPLTIEPEVLREGLQLLGASFAAVLGAGSAAAPVPGALDATNDVAPEANPLHSFSQTVFVTLALSDRHAFANRNAIHRRQRPCSRRPGRLPTAVPTSGGRNTLGNGGSIRGPVADVRGIERASKPYRTLSAGPRGQRRTVRRTMPGPFAGCHRGDAGDLQSGLRVCSSGPGVASRTVSLHGR